MSKFNIRDLRAMGTSPITTSHFSTGNTHEGGEGYSRDPRSELFILGVQNFVGENDFYENSGERDYRFKELIHAVTELDPEWVAKFLSWLRSDGNMRSASLMGAAEFLRARQGLKLSGMSRQVINSVIQRADEPGEMLAYWTSNYGRNLPQPLKRGVADACTRLINEYSFHKYSKDSAGYQIADVLDLVHPTPKDAAQSDLFAYATQRRHGNETLGTDAMPLTQARRLFFENAKVDPSVILNPTLVREAGLTWENVISLAGDQIPKRDAWESVIPSMGYMALLRNLRNFDMAGISKSARDKVAQRLTDSLQVAKSRQLPFRFLSAYKQVGGNAQWGYALSQALDLSLQNIPVFEGTSVILVDTSGSMGMSLSAKSSMRRVEAAALFGAALCQRNQNSRLFGFANGLFTHPVYPTNSTLSTTDSFTRRVGEVGHGTQIWANLDRAISAVGKIDRAIVLTDEQSADSVRKLPGNVPLYFFNLGGYAKSTIPGAGQAKRYNFGGLTDHTFKMIPLLERGLSAHWPWEE